MGDRTWVNVDVYHEDVKAFEKIVGEPSYVNDNGLFKTLEYDEYNYGAYNELELAAQARLRFRGSHGSGSEYSSMSFVCMNFNELLTHPPRYMLDSEHNQVVFVEFDERGKAWIEPRFLREAEEYCRWDRAFTKLTEAVAK